jgi:glycosyltransferase involved in cell wall biosynthesis
VLLCRNNARQLLACVKSLRTATRYEYALHIVDNGSTDATHMGALASIESVGDVHIWRESTNRWILGLNRCLSHIEKTKPKYCVVSDADIAFPVLEGKCWLELLVDSMDNYPFLGKLGASLSLSNIADKPHLAPILERERLYRTIDLAPDVFLALVDTTVAIYRPDMFVWGHLRFYPGHGSAMKPYYYAGRHKAVQVYHLGWDEEEYSGADLSRLKHIDDKVKCFAKYGGFADPVTLRAVSRPTALYYKVVSPLARAFWGTKLLFHWVVFIVRSRLIRLNELMNRVR